MFEIFFLIVCILLIIVCIGTFCHRRTHTENYQVSPANLASNRQIIPYPSIRISSLLQNLPQNIFDETDIENAIAISNQTYNEELEQRLSKLKLIKAKEHSNYVDGLECAISMEPIKDDEEIYLIKCKHIFKKEVLIDWLKKKWECPFCREVDLEIDE